jgi:hypothetical protein
LANAKIVQITDQQGNALAPQTLMSQVVEHDGQLLENLILPKDGSSAPYDPAEDYNPATKSYVDNKPKVKIVMSVQKPKGQKVGDFWYQIPGEPYVWSEVDALGYTFQDVDNLNITWAEADLGGE